MYFVKCNNKELQILVTNPCSPGTRVFSSKDVIYLGGNCSIPILATLGGDTRCWSNSADHGTSVEDMDR